MTDYEAALLSVLTDFAHLVREEIYYTKTGKHPSRNPMRDVLGQWESTLRDAEKLIAQASP